MESYKLNIKWQIIVLAVTTIALVITILVLPTIFCYTQFLEILKEVLIGIISAILLLLLVEIRDFKRDKSTYGYLAGDYKRINIFESTLEKTSDTKYRSINSRYGNVITLIKFVYKGNRKYEFFVDYEEGKVKGVIYLDQINRSEGKGVYEYVTKHENYIRPDIGNYTLLVDSLNYKILYIYHKNLIPSGLTQGYEIWEKL